MWLRFLLQCRKNVGFQQRVTTTEPRESWSREQSHKSGERKQICDWKRGHGRERKLFQRRDPLVCVNTDPGAWPLGWVRHGPRCPGRGPAGVSPVDATDLRKSRRLAKREKTSCASRQQQPVIFHSHETRAVSPLRRLAGERAAFPALTVKPRRLRLSSREGFCAGSRRRCSSFSTETDMSKR